MNTRQPEGQNLGARRRRRGQVYLMKLTGEEFRALLVAQRIFSLFLCLNTPLDSLADGSTAASGGTISLTLGQGDCVQRRHTDEEKLKQFSYRIFQIKFIVFETVLLGCFQIGRAS